MCGAVSLSEWELWEGVSRDVGMGWREQDLRFVCAVMGRARL